MFCKHLFISSFCFSAKGKTAAPTKKVCKKTTVKAKIPKKK